MFNSPISSKFFVCLFLIFFSSIILAQNSFQSGSYIDKNGVKNQGFIYNLDWAKNPSSIEFKASLNENSNVISIDNIQEFEIAGICKYIKYDGLIDVSSDKLDGFDFKRNPNWNQASILLKVLVDSDASLFFYDCDQYSRFFYSVKSKDVKIQQLVCKEFYLDGSKTQVGTNFQFRQQLSNDLVCSAMKNNLSNLKYSRKDLSKYFFDFNKCHGFGVESNNVASVEMKKVRINYALLVGASSINFETKSNNISSNVNQMHKFGKTYSYPVGAEIELVLPVNNNKWAVYFQPTYQGFKAEETVQGAYSPMIYMIDYKSLNLPIGLRHYSFLKNDAKIYLGGAVGFNFDLGSKAVFGNDANNVFFHSVLGFNLGLGYVLKNRYFFEMRYDHSFDIINNSAFESPYSGVGFVFKYKLNK